MIWFKNFISRQSYLQPYANSAVVVVGLIGFFCGLPLLLTGSTFAFWLAKEGVSLTTVGLLSLATLPYTLKFLWSPLVDRLPIPILTRLLGRRKSWLIVSQLGLALCLFCLGALNPHKDLLEMAVLTVMVSFWASTQLIVMFAYQAERLGRTQYGAGEATGIFGYRMGMLLAGAGALYLATHMSWGAVYQLMAFIELVGVFSLLWIAEPTYRPSCDALWREEKGREFLQTHPKLKGWKAEVLSWCYGAFICPFLDFAQRHKGWIACLLLMFTYKLGDNLIGNMTNIFYDHVGFSKQEIAQASKVFGMWASIFGGFLGGILTVKWGLIRSLFYGALIHGLAILCYLWVFYAGHDMGVLYWAVGLEHVTGGMRVTALFAFQLSLCNTNYAATQLALLSSIMEMGRALCSAPSGWLVENLGWELFFIVATLGTIPALLIVLHLARLEGASLGWFKKKEPSQEAPQALH